ncbi:MAG: hypothetical protein ABSG60_07005 [Terracidiphilus sp.]|jgi:hypothetical protein
MTKQLSLGDFRAVRVILEPDDFALGSDKPDPPPSDLIADKTWHGIMDLPDDVAIRTSDHRGKVLGEVYWLWGRWIEATGETEDALFSPMLDAHDDLQASLFDSLHGYYRTAFSALRNVIELMTIGACGALTRTPLYKEWRNGTTEFKFGTACDLLSNEASLVTFNEGMKAAGHQSLWDAKRAELPGGYSRRLYRNMCDFSHSRPGFTDGDLRCSNGPIFVSSVFWDWYLAYLRTTSLCSILMFLARPSGDRSAFADLFTDDPNVLSPDLLEALKLVSSC